MSRNSLERRQLRLARQRLCNRLSFAEDERHRIDDRIAEIALAIAKIDGRVADLDRSIGMIGEPERRP